MGKLTILQKCCLECMKRRTQLLERIRELVNQPDSVRAEHVDRIKRALDSGTYDISGRAVGDALIKQVLTDAVL
jgi:negative regulator of flagellin synthesis FlgM